MRDLTFTELDTEIAEQLPARELMGKGWGGCGCGGGDSTSVHQWNGSANGNTGGGDGLNVGILNGNLSGNNVAILGGGGAARSSSRHACGHGTRAALRGRPSCFHGHDHRRDTHAAAAPPGRRAPRPDGGLGAHGAAVPRPPRRRAGRPALAAALPAWSSTPTRARTSTRSAAVTGDELELRIAPEQVRHVLEHKLAPLGITADGEGFVAEPPKVDAVLALKMRVGIVGAAAVGAPCGRCATSSTRRSSGLVLGRAAGRRRLAARDGRARPTG